jgi:CrcB protein
MYHQLRHTRGLQDVDWILKVYFICLGKEADRIACILTDVSMNGFIYVALGGAAGAALRYLVAIASRLAPAAIPFGTLAANIGGCLLVGMISGYFSQRFGGAGGDSRLLLVTGFCGGFTTMSSFMYEMIQFMRDGEWWHGGMYAVCTLIGSWAAVIVGLAISQTVFRS